MAATMMGSGLGAVANGTLSRFLAPQRIPLLATALPFATGVVMRILAVRTTRRARPVEYDAAVDAAVAWPSPTDAPPAGQVVSSSHAAAAGYPDITPSIDHAGRSPLEGADDVGRRQEP